MDKQTSNRFRHLIFAVLILLITLFISQVSDASEGGAGKPITGLQVLPYGGIIPPTPGWVLTLNPALYHASLGGATQLPIAGQLAVDVDADIGFMMFGVTHIWKTNTKRWNFASGAVFPLANTGITANVILGNVTGQRSDDIFSQFDMILIPLIASYHINQLEHVSFNVTIWAPTGDYEEGRLANNGMNVWSFIPNASYTKIWPESNLTLDATYGMEFDTDNKDTDYSNGVLAYLEVMLTKRFKNGLGVGPVFGWIQQYTGDEGGLADRLDGFKGRGLGIGPNVVYARKIGTDVDFSFMVRVIGEFATKNRPKGWPILFSTSFVFD